MGKIISVVGNLGAGKTTFTRLLCAQGGFVPYWERPEERPFQTDIKTDIKRWALVNQMDFFLFRCGQEREARQREAVAIFDGGFDQDFKVFTRHLVQQGHLLPSEFEVCERFYRFARELLPPPDLIIRIVVELPTLLQRRATRARKTIDRSFDAQEFSDLEGLLDTWLEGEAASPVMRFRFEREVRDHAGEIEELVGRIKDILRSS